MNQINHSRYQKTSILVQLQNQRSHYQHILKPRDVIKIQQGLKKPSLTLHFNNRFHSETQRNRKINNQKLLMKLLDIRKKKGLLASIQQHSKIKRSHRLSLVSEHKNKQAQKQIHKANKLMAQKITFAKPIIGKRQQWDKHFQQFKSYQKKLSKQVQAPNLYQPQSIIQQAYLTLSNKARLINLQRKRGISTSNANDITDNSAVSKKKRRKKRKSRVGSLQFKKQNNKQQQQSITPKDQLQFEQYLKNIEEDNKSQPKLRQQNS